jgi:hypothetical protein
MRIVVLGGGFGGVATVRHLERVLLKSEGTFAGLANLMPYPDINEFFTTDYRARQADGRRSAG